LPSKIVHRRPRWALKAYKLAWPNEKAIAFIEEQAGSHFDPELVPIFIKILPEVHAIRQIHGDEEAELTPST